MSQYLNLYLVPTKSDKPIYLTSYCRNTGLYEAITDNVVIAFGGDKKTEITSADLRLTRGALEDDREDIKGRIERRQRALRDVTNDEVAHSILSELDYYNQELKRIDGAICEVNHLLYIVVSCCNDICAEFDKLVADIC